MEESLVWGGISNLGGENVAPPPPPPPPKKKKGLKKTLDQVSNSKKKVRNDGAEGLTHT